MTIKLFFPRLFYVLLGFATISEASYSFKIIVKYPFTVEYIKTDSVGNLIIIVDSLTRFRPLKPIIFRTETESLYQESITDSLGCATFLFNRWSDNTPVTLDNITRMAIDFPNTDRVIRTDGKINFEHLKYDNIDFRQTPEEITIVLPMTVYRMTFQIGAGFNVFNFAIMNDMHIGEGFTDFGTSGWNDDTSSGQTNTVIQNNENVVAAINNLMPDFIAVLGDVTDSGERSEFKCARKVLGRLLQKPYLPIMGNHDIWPYWGIPCTGDKASIPSETYLGKFFYIGFETVFDSISLSFAHWDRAPYFASSPDNWSYYLNSSFNYQNYKFINIDFNSRNAAPHRPPPLGGYGVLGEADVHSWSLNWITSNVNEATNSKRKLLVLGHHPLLNSAPRCFNADEIHHISDRGLKNNRPIAWWIGGHIHGECTYHPNRIDTCFYNGDTVAFVITLTDLPAKEGHYSYVQVYDKAKAWIVHYPSAFPLPVTLEFQPGYAYMGGEEYEPRLYHWDFGDGSSGYDIGPSGETHIYRLYNNLDTIFKVTFTVTTMGWRKVSCAKMIAVTASPFNLHTEYVKEDSVKLVWNFDPPSNKVEYYIVKRNGQDIAHPTTKQFIDTQNTGLQRGQTYRYEVSVRYKSWVGHADSPPATLYNVQVPWVDAPTNLAVIGQPTPTSVKIQWTDNSRLEAWFKIARQVDDGAWNENYKTVQANATQYTDTVSFLHKYHYKVRAVDNAGHYSAWSNTVEYTSGMLA